MHNLKTHIVFESRSLTPLVKEIINASDAALEKAANALNEDDIEVTVENNPELIIPERGIGGFSPDSHKIYVYIDPTHLNLVKNIKKLVKSTVTHEFHHAIRNRRIPYRTDTLLGALVTEGLADHFDLELNGGEPPIWSQALSKDEIDQMYKKAEPLFTSTNYNYNAWFFGSNEIPRWTGYSLGYKIVADYLIKNNKKASELVYVPASEFIK